MDVIYLIKSKKTYEKTIHTKCARGSMRTIHN